MIKNNKNPVYLDLFKIKMPANAIVSFGHRVSGVFLALATPLFIYLFGLSLASAEGYATAISFFTGFMGTIILLFVSWFLIHHLLAGIRFLFVDINIGVTRKGSQASAKTVMVVEVLLMLMVVTALL